MPENTDEVRKLLEDHPDVSIANVDEDGCISVNVPNTIPNDIDDELRQLDVHVQRKTPTRFEIHT